MAIFVSNCQHYDEQQFHTLSCVHYTITSTVTVRILALKKTARPPRVHIVIIAMNYKYKVCLSTHE